MQGNIMRNMLPSYVKYKMPGQIPWYVDIYFYLPMPGGFTFDVIGVQSGG